jgi:hypothetical protein
MSMFDACRLAANCEIYDSPEGPDIRFKAGMGPSLSPANASATDDADGGKLYTRAEQVTTNVLMGNRHIDFGTKGASGVGGAFHHLYDVCHQSGCDQNPLTVASRSASETAEHAWPLQLFADGVYRDWPERNAFVEAIVAAAASGEKCATRTWGNGGGYYGSAKIGRTRVCDQTNFIAVSRFAGGNLQGFMRGRFEVPEVKSGWCALFAGLAGGVASAVGGVPGVGAAAGVASGFFGGVSAICGASG